jgi:hypothetical protein
VLIGEKIRSNSEATVFAHNLLVDCPYDYRPDVNRRSQYFQPHTTITVGRKTGTAQDSKWFNNIFVRQGLDGVKAAPGYESDYNAFLAGAKKSTFGDEHSVVNSTAATVRVENTPLGARIIFSPGDALLQLDALRVDAERVGVFPTVGQTIEDRNGNPITVDTDVHGDPFTRPIIGPLANLQPGQNTITWSAEGR